MGGGGWWRRVGGVPDDAKWFPGFTALVWEQRGERLQDLDLFVGHQGRDHNWMHTLSGIIGLLYKGCPPQATMETMCIVMCGSQFLSYGADGSHRASICNGNDQISRFKPENSKMTSENMRMLVHSRAVSFLNVESLIHRLWSRHTQQWRCVLRIPTLSLDLLSHEESCCLQKVPFSFVPWSVYRQQRWNKEPCSPTGPTGTGLNVAQMLISFSHDYRLLWKWNPTYACSTILRVWLDTARGNMETLDVLQSARGVIWGQEAFCCWEILLKSN